MKSISITIYYDPRNMPDNTYSVKWSVYHNGKQKQYATGLTLSEKQVIFLKANKAGLSGRIKDDSLRLLWNRIYAETYIDQISGTTKDGILYQGQKALSKIETYFSFELFAQVVSGSYHPEQKIPYATDLLKALRNRAQRLTEQGDVSSAAVFNTTARSFERFAIYKKITTEKSLNVPMQIITKKMLQHYEAWMLQYGKSAKKKGNPETAATITTVGIFIRNIRTVFNEAVEAKVIDKDLYPFGKGGYTVPASANKKKALNENVIREIFEFHCTSEPMERAKALWIFSYLCNGMNFTDICNLKVQDVNLKGQIIEFVREKTKDSNRQEIKKIRINLFPEVVTIINRWGSLEQSPQSYLFPFLNDSMSPERKMRVIKQVIKNTNENLSKITSALNLDVKVRTYEARHSFATALLRSETPLAFISQSLGHASIATTQKYLGSFEEEQSKRYLSVLIPKPKEE
jgi:integrase